MKVGYVCTNYNGSAVTARAIETLRANVGHEIQVVVVDNASRPDQADRILAEKRDGVEILALKENLGYFSGLNAGLRRMYDLRPDIQWLIVGNNDLEFSPDFVDDLERLTPELTQYPVISPDIVTHAGEHQNPHVISSISRLREAVYDVYYSNYWLGLAVQKLAVMLHRFTDRTDEQQWQQARTIYQGHGSVYILGPRFLSHFREFWAPTFMMSEEYFLSKQLSDAGEKIFYEPRLTVKHLWHASVAELPGRKRWEMARDAHRVYRQYVKGIW